MEKLKPCKHCGGKARVICKANEDGDRLIVWGIKCEKCGVTLATWYEAEDEAVGIWNEANI